MRRRTVVVAIAVVVVGGVLLPAGRHEYPERGVVPASVQSDQPVHSAQPVEPQARSVVSQPPPEAISYPVAGTRSYAVLPGDPAVIGRAGKLMRFQIAIEGGIAGLDRGGFVRFVRATYGGTQGWASHGLWRFQQVGPGTVPDFTLLLVTPATRDLLCGAGPDRYTSCRMGNRVVLNVARWVHGVRNYNAPLMTYRQYMVNHETGHRLGRGHELCPGPGQPAPVMQQQTLGLHGCTAYAWPYVNGTRYSGRLGQYDDPIPHA